MSSSSHFFHTSEENSKEKLQSARIDYSDFRKDLSKTKQFHGRHGVFSHSQGYAFMGTPSGGLWILPPDTSKWSLWDRPKADASKINKKLGNCSMMLQSGLIAVAGKNGIHLWDKISGKENEFLPVTLDGSDLHIIEINELSDESLLLPCHGLGLYVIKKDSFSKKYLAAEKVCEPNNGYLVGNNELFFSCMDNQYHSRWFPAENYRCEKVLISELRRSAHASISKLILDQNFVAEYLEPLYRDDEPHKQIDYLRWYAADFNRVQRFLPRNSKSMKGRCAISNKFESDGYIFIDIDAFRFLFKPWDNNFTPIYLYNSYGSDEHCFVEDNLFVKRKGKKGFDILTWNSKHAMLNKLYNLDVINIWLLENNRAVAQESKESFYLFDIHSGKKLFNFQLKIKEKHLPRLKFTCLNTSPDILIYCNGSTLFTILDGKTGDTKFSEKRSHKIWRTHELENGDLSLESLEENKKYIETLRFGLR